MNKIKILLIEDDLHLTFFLKRFLENKGFHVVDVKDGYEGLLRAKKNRYNLYLIDLSLPKVNGFTIVQKVRALNNNTPIIMITDKTFLNNEIECFELGANLFHKKPINYELLVT